MTQSRIAAAVSLVVVAGMALAPAPAGAERAHGAAGGSHAIAGRRPVPPHPFGRHHFGPRPFVRPFIPLGVVASSAVVYAPSPLLYESPAVYDPPTAYYPPPSDPPPTGGTISVAPAPPPPPMPTVVPYPMGRYELHGDGATTPYAWVWIPNPPPPPPPPPPSAGVPVFGDPSPLRLSQLYRWTDEDGVVHWTDRWDAVPPQYRAQAKLPPR